MAARCSSSRDASVAKTLHLQFAPSVREKFFPLPFVVIRVLAAMNSDEAVFSQCAMRLVPFVFVLFTVNFLDRVNVAFAAVTMNRDLHFSPSVYGLGAGVFFIGYFGAQLPSNLLLARFG